MDGIIDVTAKPRGLWLQTKWTSCKFTIPSGDWCWGAATPELVWRITCDYLLAMFDTYLKSKTPSPLLDGQKTRILP
jgi:hypothetical protein